MRVPSVLRFSSFYLPCDATLLDNVSTNTYIWCFGLDRTGICCVSL